MFEKENIRWKKKGLVIEPEKSMSWAQSHCMVPTPYMLNDGLVRLYFSARDKENRSNIGFATLDLNSDGKLIEYSAEPILTPGELGCFDDNGVTPSCVQKVGDKLHLYYIGWNPGSTVRMHLFGGLAISHDDGKSFERWSKAPIIERCPTDPYLNTAPWVVRAGNEWRMYYVSGTGWLHKDLPRYNIKMARSKDGKHWKRDGHVCIDFADETENALARPYVFYEDNVWKMWFSHKGDDYRFGYAESEDGIEWHRRDEYVGLDVSESGWDSEMIEYAAIVNYKGRSFMFYNGNDYGRGGIGLAVSE